MRKNRLIFEQPFDFQWQITLCYVTRQLNAITEIRVSIEGKWIDVWQDLDANVERIGRGARIKEKPKNPTSIFERETNRWLVIRKYIRLCRPNYEQDICKCLDEYHRDSQCSKSWCANSIWQLCSHSGWKWWVTNWLSNECQLADHLYWPYIELQYSHQCWMAHRQTRMAWFAVELRGTRMLVKGIR